MGSFLDDIFENFIRYLIVPGATFWGSSRSKGLAVTAVLFLFGLVGTLILGATGWDLSWPSSVYSAGAGHGGWEYARDLPWRRIYDYGELPAIFMAIGALAVIIAEMLGKIRTDYRRPCMVIVLTVILGPGLIVNGIIKPLWGRPRPADIVQFGGSGQFRAAWQPGKPGDGRSLPSGHCASAFAISALAAFYPWHPWFGASMLLGGIAYGLLTGAARVVQGGHYPTDVLWAGVIVLMLISLLYYVVFRIPERGPTALRGREQSTKCTGGNPNE